MPGTGPAARDATAPAPVPLLFLIADTGGGHRSAATAVGQALDRVYPGRFVPLVCDPLSGPGSAWLLRRVAGMYGPAIRRAPWLWGAAYHVSNSRPAMTLLARTLLRLADGPAARAAARHRPAAIVSFHPLTGTAASRARGQGGGQRVPVVTVITDLATTHAAWRHADADLIITPLSRSAHRPQEGPGHGRWVPTGLPVTQEYRARPPVTRDYWAGPPVTQEYRAGPPVTRDYWAGPLRCDERVVLRRSLGLSEDGFLILLTGGGEGSGGIGRRAGAILRRCADVDVVAVCGRNRRLKRRLDRLAERSGGRLTVTGFAANMSDWLRCADLVVSKAGPGTIAEATCCGTPLLLTSHLPGQEKGNTELVTSAGAGSRVPGVRRLLAEIGRLRDDRGAVAAMRTASARLGRTDDTPAIAELIASLAIPGPASSAPAAARTRAATTAVAGGRDGQG